MLVRHDRQTTSEPEGRKKRETSSTATRRRASWFDKSQEAWSSYVRALHFSSTRSISKWAGGACRMTALEQFPPSRPGATREATRGPPSRPFWPVPFVTFEFKFPACPTAGCRRATNTVCAAADGMKRLKEYPHKIIISASPARKHAARVWSAFVCNVRPSVLSAITDPAQSHVSRI